MPHFADLRELFAKANEIKSGDQLASSQPPTEALAAAEALTDAQPLPQADVPAGYESLE